MKIFKQTNQTGIRKIWKTATKKAEKDTIKDVVVTI